MSDSVQVSPSVSFTILELLIMGLGCFAVLVILGVVLWIAARRGQQELMGSEQTFERQVIEQLKAPVAPAPVPSVGAARTAPLAPVAPRGSLPPLPPPDTGSPLEGLILRLQSKGMLGGFRETMKLGYPPDGQIYHLAGGGTVLILPRMESEGLLSHALTTHAMVVVPSAGGEALVITKLGEKMAVNVGRSEHGS
jgi:hypothetical protein